MMSTFARSYWALSMNWITTDPSSRVMVETGAQYPGASSVAPPLYQGRRAKQVLWPFALAAQAARRNSRMSALRTSIACGHGRGGEAQPLSFCARFKKAAGDTPHGWLTRKAHGAGAPASPDDCSADPGNRDAGRVREPEPLRPRLPEMDGHDARRDASCPSELMRQEMAQDRDNRPQLSEIRPGPLFLMILLLQTSGMDS